MYQLFRHPGKSLKQLRSVKQSQRYTAKMQIDSKDKRSRILFIDDCIPDPCLGGGFPRSIKILEHLCAMNVFITFFPFRDSSFQSTATSLEKQGIEVIYSSSLFDMVAFSSFLKKRRNFYNVIIVSRPHNMRLTMSLIRRFNQKARIIYDAEALFSSREICYREIILRRSVSKMEQQNLVAKEINLAKRADGVLTVSEYEKQTFVANGIKNVFVVSHSVRENPTPKIFNERRNILFVGSILASPSPNEDAVLSFAAECLPIIQKELAIQLLVVGTNKSTKIRALRSDNIQVLGRQENLIEFYNQCRIFIAPTRFSAGIPLKVLEAASFGLPCVVTPLLQKQLGWRDGIELMVGNNAGDFAEKCIKLYTEKSLWETTRQNALKQLRIDCDKEKFATNLKRALEL
jgi:glycosyltransferase involved in cell wall biosynthesis